jgi:hypothetical protein
MPRRKHRSAAAPGPRGPVAAADLPPPAAGEPVNLKMGFDSAKQLVGLFFGSPITEIMFTPEQAAKLGAGLIEYSKLARGH